MLSNDELATKLDASPSPRRLTPEILKDHISDREFIRSAKGTLTMCVLTLHNGFTVVGKSACADPANYNQEVGEKVAFDDAFRQLWPLYGFLLREELFKEGK